LKLPPKKPCQRALPSEAAMSFTEIGRHLGITGPGANFIYRKAMRKLRANLEAQNKKGKAA
jgi:DNA-directed RNA polymerase sigma subunit (sigma70/sigma32)